MLLKEDTWGRCWKEKFPLGNGHLGAMVSMNPLREEIDLSENTFFSGEPGVFSNQETAPGCFKHMRKLVRAGAYAEAEIVQKGFIGRRQNYGTNLPVGKIVLENQTMDEGEIRDYVRILNLENGTATAEWKGHGGKSEGRIECFASNPQNAFLYKWEGGGKTENLWLSFLPYREENGEVIYLDKGILFSERALEDLHSDKKAGVKVTGSIQVWTDGICGACGNRLAIQDGTWIILKLTMVTDFSVKASEYQEMCADLKRNFIESDGKKTLYPKWKAEHCQEFSSYMERSGLNLEDEDGMGEEISLMYQYGRYLLLSSSRENSLLPAHLQGIWNDDVACRIGWTCDMHLDINTQMNYWPAEAVNLSECAMPLFRWVENDLAESGRITARDTYGLHGWVAELVSNAWAYTAPYWDIPISPCPTGGVWIATHLWEHYLYTGDYEFLKQHVFPVISGAVDFFTDYVFWDEKEGCCLSGPSISPENSFIGEDGQVHYLEIGCTYEVLMIRELFEIFLNCCRILDISDERKEQVKHQLSNLPPYPVNADGTLGEWREDKRQADPQHRHTSHLLGLYPFSQITPEATPQLAEAARKTIEGKLNPEENWEDTGWARSLLLLYSARLRDGKQALRHINSMLQKLKAPNHLIIHPPTRGAGSFADVFEMDGNTGVTAGITEMLMQSHDGTIRILPSVPNSWKRGCVWGLRARGGLSVDVSWDNEKIEAVLRTDNCYHGWIIIGGEKKEVSLKDGEKKRICVQRL